MIKGMKPRWLMLFLLAILVAPQASLAQTFTPPPPPSCTLTATPPTVVAGDRSRLVWASKNATRGTLTVVGNIAANGSVYVVPSKTTSYTATFTGAGGEVKCVAKVTVLPFGSTGGQGGVGGDTGGPIHSEPIPPQTPANPVPDATPPGTYSGETFEGDTGGTFPTAATQITPPPTGATQDKGLVSCTGWRDCDICYLGQLLQNVINWLLGATILIAAAMFAWAGILYFTARGNTTQIGRAHAIFGSVALGFILAISGWLVIQTMLGALAKKNFFADIGGSWNTLDCSASRSARQFQLTRSIGEWLNSSLPGLAGNPVPVQQSVFLPQSTAALDPVTGAYAHNSAAGPGGTCPTGYDYAHDSEQGASSASCLNADGQFADIIPRTGVVTRGAYSDIASAIDGYFGENTADGPASTERGNKACAWAVNNVLISTGIDPLGNGVGVDSMEAALNSGRGDPVTSGRVKGDIVIFGGGLSHVGFCYNDGCTQVVSNSSTKAIFDAVSPLPSTARVYRLR